MDSLYLAWRLGGKHWFAGVYRLDGFAPFAEFRRHMTLPRREFPAKVKAAAFERAKGRCEKCTARLFVGKFHYDHIVPDALGGEPTLENCKVLCTACHGAKTGKQDVPRIAKANRAFAKHIGAKTKKPFPGGKGSKFKRKLDGTTVPRLENQDV